MFLACDCLSSVVELRELGGVWLNLCQEEVMLISVGNVPDLTLFKRLRNND